VLPELGSMITVSRWTSPAFSASTIMLSANAILDAARRLNASSWRGCRPSRLAERLIRRSACAGQLVTSSAIVCPVFLDCSRPWLMRLFIEQSDQQSNESAEQREITQ